MTTIRSGRPHRPDDQRLDPVTIVLLTATAIVWIAGLAAFAWVKLGG